MEKRLVVCLVLLLLGPAAGCGSGRSAEPSGALNAVVSIVPQQYFVEQIGGDHVSVTVMVGPGANPATYEPRPDQLAALSEADVYFSIGVPFEQAWLDRFVSVNEAMLLVDTTAGIERMAMAAHGHGEEAGDPAGGPGNPDPHIWLSPALVRVQAQTIYEALASLDPEREEIYADNLGRFVADLDTLDAGIRESLVGVKGSSFIVFHPSWGYFARDYGLEMVPIEVEGQEPSMAELEAVISEAREEGIRVVFAQPEFSTRTAEIIAGEIGGRVLLVSPLAADWAENMRRVAEILAEELGP